MSHVKTKHISVWKWWAPGMARELECVICPGPGPDGAQPALLPTEAWRPLSQGAAGSAKPRNERGWRTKYQEILDMRVLTAVISDLQPFPQTTNSSMWECDRAAILRQGSVTLEYFTWLSDVHPCYSVCRWRNDSILWLPIRQPKWSETQNFLFF